MSATDKVIDVEDGAIEPLAPGASKEITGDQGDSVSVKQDQDQKPVVKTEDKTEIDNAIQPEPETSRKFKPRSHRSKSSKASSKAADITRRQLEIKLKEERLLEKKLEALKEIGRLEAKLHELEEDSDDSDASESLFDTIRTSPNNDAGKPPNGRTAKDTKPEKKDPIPPPEKLKEPPGPAKPPGPEYTTKLPNHGLNPNAGQFYPPHSMYGYLNQQNQERTAKLMYISTICPIKFAGQPKDYPAFRARVRANLEDGLLTEWEMLELLPKFLSGEPLEVVTLMQGSSFYTVMDKLQEIFGHPQKVANSYIDSLTRGPSIASVDRKALERYSALLNGAADVLTGTYFEAASCLPNLKRMVDRLPSFARNGWEKKVVAVTETKVAPDLRDLASFVTLISKQKNNPFYQNQSAPKDRDKKLDAFQTDIDGDSGKTGGPSPGGRLRPGGSGANPRKPVLDCAVCNRQHKVSDCEIFQGMDVSQRMASARSLRLCFVCLKTRCRWTECAKRTDLDTTCTKCDRAHHKILRCYKKAQVEVAATDLDSDHKEDGSPQAEPEAPQSSGDGDPDESVPSYHSNVIGRSRFMLMILPVRVHGPDGRALTTYAFLDSGSGASFLDKSLASELGIAGPVENRTIRTVVTEHRETLQRVEFRVSRISAGKVDHVKVDIDTYVMLGVSLKDHVQGKVLPSEVDLSKFSHLSELSFPEVDRPQIGLLLGLPIQEAHEVVRYCRGKPEEPFAIETRLGFALAGPIGSSSASPIQCALTSTVPALSLEEMLERMWALDEFGNYCPEDSLSLADQQAIKRFNASVVQREDGHYQCGLTWKNPDIVLPNNRHVAFRRLMSLQKKLAKEGPEYTLMYENAMKEYIDMGWASAIPEEEVDAIKPRTYYLSHFGVTNPNKPGKVRCVFDAAEKCNGVSLNSVLLSGPDSTSSLIGVLIRARFGQYCVAGDVKAMFNQCYVSEADRDSLRFLWFDENKNVRDYRMNVHVFGAADSPFCANRMLKKIALDHGSKYEDNVVEAVNHNFYVDDALVTEGTADRALDLVRGTKSLLAEGGFELTKFVSNDKGVLSRLDDCELASPGVNLFVEPLPASRALGLLWNTEDDCFGYKIKKTGQNLTLRGLTSTVARIFDPLGFLSPVVLPARRVIQECWMRKLSWDQPIPEDLATTWTNWLKDLPSLEKLKIPRVLFVELADCRSGVRELQLHLFADSSQYATGSAAYLRAIDQSGTIHLSNLLIGKAKMLPLKPKLTIPRAEMKAAVEIARLGEKLKEELRLKLDRVWYWSDSKIVLAYIRNETRTFRLFIANRQSEIRRYSSSSQWRHAPGTLNVGDDPSRGLKISEFHANHRYLVGPSFLRQEEGEWPKEPQPAQLDANDPELRKLVVSYATRIGSEKSGILDLIDRNSSYLYILKVVAWVHRMPTSRRKDPAIKHPLTTEDLEIATRIVVRAIQACYLTEELDSIAKTNEVPRSSRIADLCPFLDEHGILRVKGRVQRAEHLDYSAKHPMILPNPKVCQLSSVILYCYHAKLAHGGLELMMAAVREQYWIIGARVFIKSLIRSCIPCRRRNARPLTQLMGDLPGHRLRAYEPAFTYVGTDCFGPLRCKSGRREVQHFGVIFLCLTTKNVHIELVPSLKTDDFLCALMRLVALRGPVKKICSDNGSNYRGAERKLRILVDSWNKDKIASELLANGIDWRFQPPYASSQSGIWERRVKETKRHLYAILSSHVPHPETLRTVLYEVASIMNQVPLCPVSQDPDSLEALTPAHFLFQRPVQLAVTAGDEDDHSHRRECWRTVCHLSTLYWKRWLKEYIPTLHKRQKWTNRKRNLAVGDLVMIANSDLPRSRWLLGRVTAVNKGSTDGLVRSAVVKTPHGEFLRPIQKLAVIHEANNED